MKNAIFYLFSFLLIQLFASSLISLLGLPFGWKSQSIPVLIASSVLSSVLTIALFTWRKWTPVNRRYMLSRPWLVLIWSGIASYGALIPSLGLQDLLPEMPNLIDSELEGILKNRWGYFAIGLAAPVAEEFVFRGAVLRSLLGWAQEKGRSHWVAILVSALLFSVAHFNPAQMIHAFLIGILLGWMYYRTGSIIPGIIYHWVNNSLAYVMENLMPGMEHLSDIFGNNAPRIALGVAFSFCILLPALYQLHKKMRRADENA